MSQEKLNFKASKLLLLVHLLALLVIAHGKLPPEVSNDLNAPAVYILGDSSVDCGDNTLFYPLIHSSMSLYSCNGSDSTLIPHLLGNF